MVTSVKSFKVSNIQKDIWKIQHAAKDKFEFLQKRQLLAKVRVIYFDVFSPSNKITEYKDL